MSHDVPDVLIASPGVELLVSWEWWIVGICVSLAVVVGSVAAWLPAWRAAQLSPIQAMREQGAVA